MVVAGWVHRTRCLCCCGTWRLTRGTSSDRRDSSCSSNNIIGSWHTAGPFVSDRFSETQHTGATRLRDGSVVRSGRSCSWPCHRSKGSDLSREAVIRANYRIVCYSSLVFPRSWRVTLALLLAPCHGVLVSARIPGKHCEANILGLSLR